MLFGVDVSGHQPTWKPTGKENFVGVKTSEGRTVVNTARKAQIDMAHKAHAIVLHYHYMWPGNAKEQAAYFVSNLHELIPGDLLVCDWENTPGGHASVADAANFIAEVKRLKPNYRTGLYCNKSDWLSTAVKRGDFLWLAHYTEKTDVKGWDFWQYTDKPIDQNRARFATVAEMLEWATPSPAVKPDPGLFWSDTWQSNYLAFGGASKWTTPTDKEILIACAKASDWGSVRIVQGGRRPKTSYSGTTHMGLGVGDIGIDGHSKAAVWEFCAALRRSGIRPFPRGYGGDPWTNEKHIHYCSRESYAHASESLQAQVREQEAGGDGLQGSGRYNGPTYAKLDRWKGSPYNPANTKPDVGKYRVASGQLIGYTVDEKPVRQRSKGYIVQAAQEVNRFGRPNIVTATPTYYSKEFLERIS